MHLFSEADERSMALDLNALYVGRMVFVCSTSIFDRIYLLSKTETEPETD